MTDKISIGIFIADEGYGHAVRQITIIKNIINNFPNLDIHIYSGIRLSLIKSRLGNSIKYHYLNNLIRTFKTDSGGLDVDLTNEHFINIANFGIIDWFKRAKFLNAFSHDILIGDSIPQLSLAKSISEAIIINLSHFTWDWFWINMLKDPPVESKIFLDLYSKFDHYIFGYLTPSKNIDYYLNQKIHRIGLILQNQPKSILIENNFKKMQYNCLLMDNGTRTLSNLIEKALPDLIYSEKLRFFVGIDSLSESAKKIIVESTNMIPISGLKKMHETMIDSDFVVARGGFNTLSEVIAYKIPGLLIKETDNPEIAWNIEFAKSNNFCKSLDPNQMIKGLLDQIYEFINNDYQSIYESLTNTDISIKGELDFCALLKNILNL